VVRGAFTKKAWEGSVRSMLDAAKDDSDAWVLGLSKSASGTELRVEYFRLYLAEWKQFIESIRIEPPHGNDEAMAMLEELSRTRPFLKIFAAVAVNTKVSVDSEAAAGFKAGLKKSLGNSLTKLVGAGIADAGMKALSNDPAGAAAKELATSFSGLAKFGYAPPGADGQPPPPTPLVLYMEDLEKLRDALRNSIENPKEMVALTSLLSTVRVKVKSSVEQQEPGWRPTIERFVWPPISWLTTTTLAVAAEESSNKWCSQVATPYLSRLAGRYPFRKDGKDAPLDDAAEFYRPGGLVDSFYEGVLKKDVQRSGGRYEFVKSMGDAPPYSVGLLQFLRRASEIQSALFPPQSPDLKVDFAIHVRPAKNVASTTLTIDGETYEYRNGQEEWKQMKWPGPQKGSGASIRMKSKQGLVDVVEFSGDWALFRLIEAGQLTSWPGERAFAITWDAPNLEAKVTIDFKPARTDNPFRGPKDGSGVLEVLRGTAVAAPASIGLSTPPCKRP
jgi:type VI secretion system protein ImpL